MSIAAAAADDGERFIIVPLYSRVGLCNQWISLQLAVVLAHLTRRTLILDTTFAFVHAQDAGKEVFAHVGRAQPSDVQLTDLFDVPVRMRDYRKISEFKRFLAENQATTTVLHDWPTCFLDCVIQVDERIETGRKAAEFEAFRHKRPKVLALHDLQRVQSRVLRMRLPDVARDPPTFYFAQPVSLFYTADKALRADIARVSASVRPKPIFINLARALAMHVSRHFGGTHFFAIHLRRGDKIPGNPYIGALKSEWLIEQVHRVFETGTGTNNDDDDDDSTVPLLVSTCSPGDPMIAELRKSFPRMVLVDDHLAEHGRHMLQSLPFGDHDVVRAFVSLLTCTHARRFMGTQGSTFSSYIQHIRGVQGIDTRLDYCYPNRSTPNKSGRWSWNRCNTEPCGTGWFLVHPEDWEHFRPVPVRVKEQESTAACSPQLYPIVSAVPLL